MNVSHVGS